MRKNISLPEYTADRLKRLSLSTGISESALIQRALDPILGMHEISYVRFRLDFYENLNHAGILKGYFSNLDDALINSIYGKVVKHEPSGPHSQITVFLSKQSNGNLGWEDAIILDTIYLIKGA